MANALAGLLRGLSGGRSGIGNINYMKPVGAMTGGGVRANAGSAPQVRAPGSSDLMVNPNSALSHGDALLKGYWEEWMPTPQQKQARTNDEAFVQALIGAEGQPGLAGQTITPETLQAAMGRAKEGGANAAGMIDILNFAIPTMRFQENMANQRALNEAKLRLAEAKLNTENARTAKAQQGGSGRGGRKKSSPSVVPSGSPAPYNGIWD